MLIVVSCFFISISVSAEGNLIQASKGLTLSPLRSELDITPGTSLDGELTVSNPTENIMSVNFNAEEFSVINQQYDYAFTPESDIAKWIKFTPADIDLGAGESKKVSYRAGVPLSAEPGGRYISMFASTSVGNMTSGNSSKQRIGSLLYITVLGDVSRSGNLISITSPWAVSGETKWSAVLQNTGTTHYLSRYSAQIKNLFGGNEAVANMSGETLILPGTVRAISDNIPLPQLPGIYKIIYNIGLGDTPARIEARYVLYLPPISGVIVVAIIVVFGLWLRKKRTVKPN